jgi:hypothetical protein
MPTRWRDVAEELAGPGAALSEYIDHNVDEMVVASADMPDALLSGLGHTPDQAWRRLSHRLGDFRLVQALEAAGWTDIDEVIDETTYVVARDRGGALWAIGVAAVDGDRRGYIERDIGFDARAFNRVAFIEPLDTRDSGALFAALEENA